MKISALITTALQYILPHHGLSRLMSLLTHSQYQPWKNLMIRQIIKFYQVNMEEAKQPDIQQFKSFNQFFTRELKSGARIVTPLEKGIACPADGEISQVGRIQQGRIFQAKGKDYSTLELLGDDVERAARFDHGSFTTIYLSPKDYHRLHMPLTGKLTEMIHIPGRLFSVNQATVETVPRLFARNERVVCLFNTDYGEMALILVGAIFVSSIETVWHGVVTPPTTQSIQTWHYDETPPIIEKGQEMGRFNMGSTIIVLFAKDRVNWDGQFKVGKKVCLGQLIGMAE